jgi:putative membrane protein
MNAPHACRLSVFFTILSVLHAWYGRSGRCTTVTGANRQKPTGKPRLMNRLPRRYPGAAIIAGAVGGLIGGWFKLGWEVTWPPRAADRIPEPMVLVTLFSHVATPSWVSLVIHFAFSILSGVAYGILVEFFPIVAIGAGVGFGLAVWIGAHEIVMPWIGLTPPVWKLPLNEQGSELFGHALWGFVIGIFVHDIRSRLVPAQSSRSRSGPSTIVPVAESVAVF